MTHHDDVRRLADEVFAAGSSSDTGFDAALWATLEQTGLARLTVPEQAGGSGGTFTDAVAVLGAAGAYAARAPVMETDFLAGWLLHTCGLDVPTGPLTAAATDRPVREVARVPWARAARLVVVLAGTDVLLVEPESGDLVEGVNVAEEPRDTVVVDGVAVAATVPEGSVEEFRLRAALGRAMLLTGAARAALARAVTYATEREQFGRPIGRFQAVQQQLAVAAGEVAAATAATSAAARAADRDGVRASAFAIQAAKVRTGQAAGEVARIAHQVHGAIGFTREHDLRLNTTRLWAWRDEDGSEVEWAQQLGDRVLEAGAEGLWPLVTGRP